jgi:peptide/nickel transport system substrate-binding protein
MRKFRWQLLIILVTGLVVGLLLYFQQSFVPAPQTISTPSPVSGGIYTEAIIGRLMRLNPLLAFHNQADRDVNRLIFNSLIRFDAHGLPQPELAETWTYSADGSRYTFSLRPEVYWHDGVRLTSQDVVFTVSLLQSQNAAIPEDLRVFWSKVRVNALADDLVQFALPEAFAPFLDYLNFQILPAHLLGDLSLDEMIDHPFNIHPIGTGPYKFVEAEAKNGQILGLTLKANEGYFLGAPFIQDLVIRYYDDGDSAFRAYQAGEVDGVSRIDLEVLSGALAQTDLNLYSMPEPRLNMVFLNLKNIETPFFQDSFVRKALMMAVNRRAIIDQHLQGQAVLAEGPIMPGNWAFYSEQGSYSFDPEAARQLLLNHGMTQDEDGLVHTAEGIALRFELLHAEGELETKIAQSIQENWAAIGVQVELQGLAFDQLLGRLAAHDYDAAFTELDLSGTPDPDPYPFWGQAMIQSGQNYSQWDDRQASEFLEQARINPDLAERTRFYRNFQAIFHEQLPSLPLFYPIYNYAVKDSINDVQIGLLYDPSDRFESIQKWYILVGNQGLQNNPSPTP